MSLIPEAASEAEVIEALWLALTGRCFSPLDADLVCRWLERGIPGHVLAAAIRDSLAAKAYDCRPSEPPLCALRHCRPAVERRFQQWLRRNLGRGSR